MSGSPPSPALWDRELDRERLVDALGPPRNSLARGGRVGVDSRCVGKARWCKKALLRAARSAPHCWPKHKFIFPRSDDAVFESPLRGTIPARSTRGTTAESRRLVSTASHAFYVLCCLKETRHRSRLRRRHLAREEAANEHRKRNDRGGRDRRGPALAPARGVWPRVHAPPGGRLGARVRTQGPRRRDRCVLLPRVPPSRERRAQIADLAVGTRQTKPPLPLRFAPLSAAPSRDPRSFDPASASSATPPTDRVDPLRVPPSPRHRDRSRRSRAQPRT